MANDDLAQELTIFVSRLQENQSFYKALSDVFTIYRLFGDSSCSNVARALKKYNRAFGDVKNDFRDE